MIDSANSTVKLNPLPAAAASPPHRPLITLGENAQQLEPPDRTGLAPPPTLTLRTQMVASRHHPPPHPSTHTHTPVNGAEVCSSAWLQNKFQLNRSETKTKRMRNGQRKRPALLFAAAASGSLELASLFEFPKFRLSKRIKIVQNPLLHKTRFVRLPKVILEEEKFFGERLVCARKRRHS